MTGSSILVLGGAHIDRRGRISGETVPGASNPGSWFEEAGGGGFNAARNLARLGHSVSMVSPLGGDREAEAVSEAAELAGVEHHPMVFLDRKTPSYTAILEGDGNLVIALADMELYRLFGPRRMESRQMRQRLEAAGGVLVDANLPSETLGAIAAKTASRGVPLAGIAISPAKVVRYRPLLGALSMLFLNEAEAAALAGRAASSAAEWPALLKAAGLRGGAVTRGAREAVLFDETGAVTLAPPPAGTIADVTGAGDSFAAGVLSALIHKAPLAEAIRWGTAAARITLASPLACAPDLSLARLRETLPLVPQAEILS